MSRARRLRGSLARATSPFRGLILGGSRGLARATSAPRRRCFLVLVRLLAGVLVGFLGVVFVGFLSLVAFGLLAFGLFTLALVRFLFLEILRFLRLRLVLLLLDYLTVPDFSAPALDFVGMENGLCHDVACKVF
ncbi:hypothetical protein, partial [Rhodococcus opacus]|uniref:hypothetical protein n=1 Tax=Rhodococcus opacus TaxID=37919 RepID=UPI001B8081C6